MNGDGSMLVVENRRLVVVLLSFSVLFSVLFAVVFVFLSPEPFVSLALALFLYAIAFSSLKLGVLTLFFALPFSELVFLTGPTNVSVPEVALFALLFSWSLKKIRASKLSLGGRNVFLLLSGLVLIGFLSIVLSGSFSAAASLAGVPSDATYEMASGSRNLQALMGFRGLLRLLEWLIAYVVAAEAVKAGSGVRKCLASAVAGALTAVAFTLPEYVGGLKGDGLGKLFYWTRFGMLFTSQTSAAVYLMLSIIFCVGLFMSAKNRTVKVLLALTFIALSTALFFTYARTAFVLYALTVILLVLAASGRGWVAVEWRKIAVVAVILVSAGVLLNYSYIAPLQEEYGRDIIVTMRFSNALESFTGVRVEGWRQAVEIIRDNPGGVGLGRYPIENCRNIISGGGKAFVCENAHNYYLQVLAELGFAGFFVFIWVLHEVGRDSMNALKAAKDAKESILAYSIILAVSSVVLYSVIDHPLLVPSLSILFWAQAGFLNKIGVSDAG